MITQTSVHILVIDDEPFIRSTVKDVLTDEGFLVQDAPTADQGLKYLAAAPFDLVLLDIKMPGMDGMEAFKLIREARYNCDVVMISGHGTIETAVDAIKLGAFDFLEKPFTLEKLKTVVAAVIGKRSDARRQKEKAVADKPAVSRYRIVGKIAAGGSATVYRAVQTDLGRTVALKVLHEHLTGTDEFHTRFLQEARITASLSHPNIVQLYDYGCEEKSHYLAMEFVEGASLDYYLDKKKRLPLAAGLLVVSDICRALDHAHRHGVIHRDLKPQNILIASGGGVKLADFGLARLLDGSQQRLTAPGHIAGTPQFISPEQVRGNPVTAQSDIFSLGTLLYLLATERLPFFGANVAEVVHRISKGPFEPPRSINPDLSESLESVITTCLAHEPQQRYATANDLLQALTGCIGDGACEARAKYFRA